MLLTSWTLALNAAQARRWRSTPGGQLLPILVAVGNLVGPAMALLYAVHPSLLTVRPRQRQIPEDVMVSRLGVTDDAITEPEIP
ncbi:MAG: hypothetical protein ABI068_01985 [Ktedonobacterales bacterium]